MTAESPNPSYADIAGTPPDELAKLLNGDPRQAARWLLAAARYGLVQAQTAYAQLLLDGRGVARDPVGAHAWFSAAASAGSVEATNMLGRCHELGWGVPADAALAAQHYRVAAEAGLDWGQYNLANLLARGDGVPLDRAQALDWYLKAAGQGHAKSLNLMGRFLEEGWAVPADPEAACELYRRAAEGGDFRGQFNHASVLARRGETAEAALWFRRAAATGTQGFLRSMAASLAQSPQAELRAIALEVLERCCASGQAADFYAYGLALLPMDQQGGRRWLRRAAALGHAEAGAALARLGPLGRLARGRARLRHGLYRLRTILLSGVANDSQ